MKKYACILLLLPAQLLYAQQEKKADSAILLDKLVVTAFQQNRAVVNGTIVKVLGNAAADRSNKISLLNGLNTIAGVRMEERSPGSYRLNIRGSSLRAPFGVRNVKVYWNDIPVTDAGGNTYFNQFALNNFSSTEVFKGPSGSLYGAGTGGLLLLHSFENVWKPGATAEYITGSYGLRQLLVATGFGNDANRSSVTYAHLQSDGYRSNTQTRKDNVTVNTRLKNSEKQQLTASVLYTDQYYQTPGGLTNAEFTANPKQARPAAGGLPGALTAKAAIYQKNFLAGISNQYNFTKAFKNSTSLYGTIAQIQNPTFRNYERRTEPGFGGRTLFEYEKKSMSTTLQLVAGAEWQEGFFNTQVAKNKNGMPDTLQTNDDIRNSTRSFFAQADISLKQGWIVTAGASINAAKVAFTRLSSFPVIKQGRTYNNEWSPRLAFQKKAGNSVTLFASIAKGFSPPTIAELLPSTGVISTFLEAEAGVNYEAGGRLVLLKNKLSLEATAFYFKLQNALVSRKDSSNADYFVNAGNTQQKGIELSADYNLTAHRVFLRSLIFKAGVTLNNFKYGNFRKGTSDFSGKFLPGVPASSVSVTADWQLAAGVYFNGTYYYCSKIYLDDANLASAAGYHLLGIRVGGVITNKYNLKLRLYAGADNLLNETYSLGNDINAAAGRYYNAAPLRNYYAGIALQWQRSKKDKEFSLQ